MVERYPTLGGVCLNVGCIPSKALLHVAKVIAEAETLAAHGVAFGDAEDRPRRAARRGRRASSARLTGGLGEMAKRRKVAGRHAARRASPARTCSSVDGRRRVARSRSTSAIVAAGSRAVQLPGIPHDDPRVMDSTGALELADVPERLLVVGGGIIGLEMATVYDALARRSPWSSWPTG